MNCKNFFCIYHSQGECTIETISINSLGLCTECIYPDIDEKILERAKLKLLKKYEDSN